MSGEKNLSSLLNQMDPVLNERVYVFCTVIEPSLIDQTDAVVTIKEKEGTTLVLLKEEAEERQLDFIFECNWITCKVHSSLEAVGLTAAFSSALANENISCNVVAGYFHDHIFVPISQTKKAMEVLRNLSATQ